MSWDVGDVGKIEKQGDPVIGYWQGLIEVAQFGD